VLPFCSDSHLPISPLETWALTLRKEHRLRVFETRVLWRIFGLRREEVVGGWKKLHNERLHNLYTSPNSIRVIKLRRMRWVGHLARMGEMRCIKIFGQNT
jgi:hypothetical protein